MRASAKTDSEAKIVLNLLQSLEREHEPSHRSLASELGIALGLTNAYLKRCVSKGFLKVRTTPARRYAYFLTKRGFAEKSRLTAHYLSYSLSLFRQARTEYGELLAQARHNGWNKIALIGCSDLAEIVALCAMDCGIQIFAIVDLDGRISTFLGRPVMSSVETLVDSVQAVVITEMVAPQAAYEAAAKAMDESRILFPALLGLRPAAQQTPRRQ